MAKNFRSFRLVGKKIATPSKHLASKKGYKHTHKPSKGELNTNCYIGRWRVNGIQSKMKLK